jgi:predicted glycosyltransferase involved in capsule biosynthesis
MDFSIVIPCNNNSSRLAINEWTQEWYRTNYPDTEVIVSRNDTEPFNKSKAVNQGVQRSTNDLLVIADSDTVILPDQLQKAFYDYPDTLVIPFNQVLDLSQETTLDWLNGHVDFKKVSTEKIRKGFHRAGGVWVISKEIYNAVGGLDERYAGWGGEDDSFCRAVCTLVKTLQILQGDVYHLWHEQNPLRKTFMKTPNYPLWRDYCRATHDPKRMERIINGRY